MLFIMEVLVYFSMIAIASFIFAWYNKQEEQQKLRAQEELRKQEEERRKQEEERKKREEERSKQKEEELRQLNMKWAERRKQEEELRRQEEERRKQEEELRKQEEERRKQEEEYRKRAEERKRQEEKCKRQEEERRRQEEERRRQEEERKKQEEERRRQEEEYRKRVEERRKQAEERRKQEEEYRKRAEEARRKQKEEEKRRVEDQIALVETYHVQLKRNLNSLGGDLTSVYDSEVTEKEDKEIECTYLYVPEEVNIKKLLELLKEKVAKCKYTCRIKCLIKDINEKDLVEILIRVHGLERIFKWWSTSIWEIVFYQEDRESIVFNKDNDVKRLEDFLFCYLENRKIKRFESYVNSIIENGIEQVGKQLNRSKTTEKRILTTLKNSDYKIDFQKSIDCLIDNGMLIVNYELPHISNLSEIKEYKYIASSKEIRTKTYTETYITKRYENVLYSITLRSVYEIFFVDKNSEIKTITFNGFVTRVNPATGIRERKCILSLQVDREKFSQINLLKVEPKACFKALKGVSAAKLIDITPIAPILIFNKKDKRFVAGKDVSVNQGTNLAAMHWEDFEHLVRELFELEFARNGGEVRVTQASRDGGVDAIVFDPDPLRGGKIVLQAKRYTNTVGVSAVRDLYGTVINEGANTGILITTSDYGHDSYEFAKDKPLKLLNGGHLLALLHKNGKNAHINIEEAKRINEDQKLEE